MTQVLLTRRGLSILGLAVALWGACTATTAGPAGHLMSGTPHQTAYYVSKGATAGPVVFVVGGCHGDETAGYLAGDKLAKWQATKGTLVVIPRAHVTAIARNTRGWPGNMNRMFPGKADGDMMQRLAYETWMLIKKWHPALLVTLHESRAFHAEDRNAFGQTLTYDFHQEDVLFRPAVDEANKLIRNKRDRFSLYVYPVETCPTYCAYQRLKIPATSIETCRKLKLETRVQYQLLMSRVLLKRWGLKWQEPK